MTKVGFQDDLTSFGVRPNYLPPCFGKYWSTHKTMCPCKLGPKCLEKSKHQKKKRKVKVVSSG